MTRECVMRKTVEDIERAARCPRTSDNARQTAILILVELRAGVSFEDPYVAELYRKLTDTIGCNITDEDV